MTAEALDIRVLRSIPTPLADNLLARGIRTSTELLASPAALSEAMERHHAKDAQQKASSMLQGCRQEATAASTSWNSSNSALSLLQQLQDNTPVTLPCQGLNELLGNALRPSGSFFEVFGLPGAGKTQFCLQLCAAAQISSSSSSTLGEAIYVDTEGSFVPRRYMQVCRALLSERRPSAQHVQLAELEAVMRGLHVCRAYDATELFSTLKQLGSFLKSHPRVRVLVVDSVAFSFRHEFMDNTSQRARVLGEIAATLRKYGSDFGLVVAVTNHMTTRFDRGNDAYLAPALGETWAHQPSTQIRLEKCSAFVDGCWQQSAGSRATLTKSVEKASGQSCAFRILPSGIRDVEDPMMRQALGYPAERKDAASFAQMVQFMP